MKPSAALDRKIIMRVLIQRVKEAQVVVDGKITGQIGVGMLTLLGVGPSDRIEQVDAMVSKLIALRIFEDENGKMNKNLIDIKGQHLVVSQFTLYADCKKGNRPSFTQAGPPELAKSLYESFIEKSRAAGIYTQAGVFGADMQVTLTNDGPVTLFLESES